MKKSALFISLVILMNLIAVSLFPSHFTVHAAGGEEPGYFVIEKTWVNDTDEDGAVITEDGKENRPESVTIVVEGSDGSSTDVVLKGSERWRKAVTLPTKDGGGNPITYTAFEKDVPAKYISNATSENKIAIKQIKTGRQTDEFVVNNEGFANVPHGTVRIDPKLAISRASKVELSDGFVYETNQKVYTNPGTESEYNDVAELIAYKGDLNKFNGSEDSDNKLSGTIRLTWPDNAEDLEGNKYDVRITLSNIVIRALADMKDENAKRVAILGYNDSLCMQSYVMDFTSTPNENIVGVKADILIEVLGIPANNYTQVIFDDIDIPDQVDYFYDHNTTGGNSYYGLKYPFAEAVVVNGNPSSDVYITNGKTYLVYDNTNYPHKFASTANNNDSTPDNHYTTIEYLAPAEGYSFTWTGSDCGTELVMNAELADPSTYLNTITNTTSVYKVRYFYMDDEGKYPSTPDSSSELRMLAPNTATEVTEEDKTPTKEGYKLDSEYAGNVWSGTTTVANDAKNPLTLDVYFKKTYTVIYHDNVGDIVWKPETQTNPDLDYGVATPGFDTDKETADIQPGDPVRMGYDFLGWSEEPTSPVFTVPAIVTKNADYWAHWAPGVNKYKVEYYYEVNGKYPSTPDFTSADRAAKTEDHVEVTAEDKVPMKSDYYLNTGMDTEWKGVVLPDGSLVLKVYFKQKAKPTTPTYTPPTTGIE